MTSTHCIDRLSEYIDGDLPGAEQAQCEAHLAVCDDCRGIAEDLRGIAAAGKTVVDVSPASDLWPGVRSRLFGASSSLVAVGHDRAFTRRVTFTLPQLALAASLLAAVSIGVTSLALRERAQPGGIEAPVHAEADPAVTLTTIPPADFADAQFDRAIGDLERVLRERRDTLDPRTVQVLERNLAAIDSAIREARAALDVDPADTFLNTHLADARRRKLELLRRATTLGD